MELSAANAECLARILCDLDPTKGAAEVRADGSSGSGRERTGRGTARCASVDTRARLLPRKPRQSYHYASSGFNRLTI